MQVLVNPTTYIPTNWTISNYFLGQIWIVVKKENCSYSIPEKIDVHSVAKVYFGPSVWHMYIL